MLPSSNNSLSNISLLYMTSCGKGNMLVFLFAESLIFQIVENSRGQI